jgi:ComF family protein
MGIVKDLQNLFFLEKLCLFCRDENRLDQGYICGSCREQVEFLHKELEVNIPYVEKAYYSVFYNRFIKDKIHAFKYKGKIHLYKAFGHMMITTIYQYNLQGEIDAIAFVPMHRRKEALRGYNQAKLLGEYLAKELKKPLLKKNLVKIKDTKDQNKLSKVERRVNLMDSFKGINSHQFSGKKILLVDDIITTGTTISECGKALVKGGASKIYGIAITSTMKA